MWLSSDVLFTPQWHRVACFLKIIPNASNRRSIFYITLCVSVCEQKPLMLPTKCFMVKEIFFRTNLCNAILQTKNVFRIFRLLCGRNVCQNEVLVSKFYIVSNPISLIKLYYKSTFKETLRYKCNTLGLFNKMRNLIIIQRK